MLMFCCLPLLIFEKWIQLVYKKHNKFSYVLLLKDSCFTENHELNIIPIVIVMFDTRTSFFEGNTLITNLISTRVLSFNIILILVKSKNVNVYDALS